MGLTLYWGSAVESGRARAWSAGSLSAELGREDPELWSQIPGFPLLVGEMQGMPPEAL